MPIRYNTESVLMAYFNVNALEFSEFWRSLTPSEQNYYRTATLV
jgi:hypothetical protein